MRLKLLLLSLLVFAASACIPEALAQTFGADPVGTATISYTCSAGTCTNAAPTVSTDGFTLRSIGAYRITVCADSGQTLSGAGKYEAYYFNTLGVWGMDHDLDLQATLSAKRCQTFPDKQVWVRSGLADFVPNGVTVSSGNLTMLIEGSTR